MVALAEHYARKAWPDLVQPIAAKDVAVQANRANGAISINTSGSARAPRLVGQTRDYLEKTMTDFRSGERGNNPGVTDLMGRGILRRRSARTIPGWPLSRSGSINQSKSRSDASAGQGLATGPACGNYAVAFEAD
jgi:hypothetical protein